MEIAFADVVNGILRSTTTAAPLKHLINFLRLLEILINDIFTSKDTKLYVYVVTLSPKDNSKLSKALSKRFQRSLYWKEYEIKSEN